jgi:hypothetical protein
LAIKTHVDGIVADPTATGGATAVPTKARPAGIGLASAGPPAFCCGKMMSVMASGTLVRRAGCAVRSYCLSSSLGVTVIYQGTHIARLSIAPKAEDGQRPPGHSSNNSMATSVRQQDMAECKAASSRPGNGHTRCSRQYPTAEP